MSRKFVASALIGSMAALSGGNMGCPINTCDPSMMQPNPAVIEIRFEVIEPLSGPDDTTGRVRISAVVRNVGTTTFDTGDDQQSVQLFEDGTMVAEATFNDLPVGAEVIASFDRDWDVTLEFPPTYRGLIVYDPDVFIDGNPLNDDCFLGDNDIQTGSELVNTLLGA